MSNDMDWGAEVDESLKQGGNLWVGRNETNEVAINHPLLDVDADGIGHIVFSPAQARNLAALLLKHADECERSEVITMKIFKAEAEGDVVYIEAGDLDDAKKQFRAKVGDVPESMLTFTEVSELPQGEEFL